MKKALMVLTIICSTIILECVIIKTFTNINNITNYRTLKLSDNEQVIYDNMNYEYTRIDNAFITFDDNIIIYRTSYITKDKILVYDEFYYVKVSAIYNNKFIEKGLYQDYYINDQNKEAIVEAMSYGIHSITIENLNNKLKRDY